NSVTGRRPPSLSAAHAIPSAWLPADAATTPRRRASSVSMRRWLSPPRTLKDPVGCQHSSFSHASWGRSANERRNGVGGRNGRMRSRASSISAGVSSVVGIIAMAAYRRDRGHSTVVLNYAGPLPLRGGDHASALATAHQRGGPLGRRPHHSGHFL